MKLLQDLTPNWDPFSSVKLAVKTKSRCRLKGEGRLAAEYENLKKRLIDQFLHQVGKENRQR